ncbi:MAG TPA: O-antigen ligase family protein [Terriglobales bacterium]|jgi:O-antigen ligase|nr:O-antigen ligase family protein [Terriglobales bacterium]
MIKEITNPKSSLARLAFWFWALTIFRFAFALLFFRDNPVAATGVGSALSVGFAYYLLLWFLRTEVKPAKFTWPPIGKWIVLYVVWCAISLYWSHSGSFVSAVGYWATMAVDLVVVAAMLKWGDTDAIVLASLKGIVAGCGLIALVALIFTSTGADGRLGNVEFLHPTNIGNFASIGALCCIYFWQRSVAQQGRERWYWAGGAIFISWVLILSLSKTSMIAFVFAFGFLVLYSVEISLKTKLMVLLLATILFAVMYGTLAAYITEYQDDSHEVTTLTGRTVLWAETWEMIQDHPIAGYGFLSFRDFGPQDWDERATMAHDEWLNQWFQLGGVGLLLTLGIYGSYFRYLWRSPRSLARQLGLTLLIYMLIDGITMAEPVGLMFPLPMMLLLTVWMNVSRGPETAKTVFARANTGPLRSLLRQPSC